ncbi:uncharacterized protein [Diabrotica undecimpunctata]|uniref:uncharacterized protein n=1 Tax=Diabrotica undecimpunctata TaxID=50387 RepID=UPI003B637EF1
MKLFLAILLCVIFVISAKGDLALLKGNDDQAKKHNSDCYTDEYNLGAMKKTEVKRVPGACRQATCNDDNTIEIEGCGVVAAQPPCHTVPADVHRHYPDCCLRIVCPK